MSRDAKVKSTVEHSIIFDGTKHVSGQAIHCMVEGCEHTERIATNNFSHRLPDDVLKRKFQQRGWVWRKGWYCPTHAHQRHQRGVDPITEAMRTITLAAKPIPVAPAPIAANTDTPKETTPVPTNPNIVQHPLRSFGDLATATAIDRMTTSDKRRIFREIDENWDDDKGRYIGGAGDQAVASKLNVARAWVEHIRKESFGDSASSEEIDEVREEVLLLKGKLSVAVNDAMVIAGKIEGYFNQVKALERRLEKVENAVGVRR